MAVQVGRPGAETERRMFVTALLDALRRPADPEVKAFLISEVQLAGRAEAAEPLAAFLGDERLVGPAARALVAIRAPGTAKRLEKALDAARGPSRPILIKALGDLGSRDAVGKLLKYAASDDPPTRRAALFALAESGDPAAEPALDRARIAAPPNERAEAPALYLRYARRLIAVGRVDAGLRICRSLLASQVGPEKAPWPGKPWPRSSKIGARPPCPTFWPPWIPATRSFAAKRFFSQLASPVRRRRAAGWKKP